MKRIAVIVALAIVTFGSVSSAVAEENAEASLYDRLGGVYNIAMVVDHLIELLMVNETLNANPALDHARQVVPEAGIKYRVTEMMCQATGGPCTYSGRSMLDAHAHLSITEAEWDAMTAEFIKTLNHFEVPEKEQKELLDIMASTKADIVKPTAN